MRLSICVLVTFGLGVLLGQPTTSALNRAARRERIALTRRDYSPGWYARRPVSATVRFIASVFVSKLYTTRSR